MIAIFDQNDLRVVAIKMKILSKREVRDFYQVHSEKSFFQELTEYMTRGPVVIMVLEGKDAVQKNRDVMGATNPSNAKDGTIRKLFASSIQENTVHGSDSLENAKKEIRYFFSDSEVFGS
ncbi:MAG: nucleoside-diphosphate kinase [Proteobacteria bacterium]|nr:nucleoside-diphosphate kinase [Pseudomonadota bacterium]